MKREPSAPDLADLGVPGRIAGPAHPVAAKRFQRAIRSGDAPKAKDGQVGGAVREVRGELGSQRDGAGRGRSCLVDLVRSLPSPTSSRRVPPSRSRPRASLPCVPTGLARRALLATGGGGRGTPRSRAAPVPTADCAGTCNKRTQVGGAGGGADGWAMT